jgi:hypothetical protein
MSAKRRKSGALAELPEELLPMIQVSERVRE